MNMLISELQMLASDWRSWIVVGVMGALVLHSLTYYFMCPYVHGRANITDEAVVEARERVFKPGARYGLMMVLGIVLTVTGLFMIADGVKPTLALAAMVAGIVIVQTEPTRTVIRENTQRVISLRDDETSKLEAAALRLRGSHVELVVKNLVLFAALIAGILAFG